MPVIIFLVLIGILLAEPVGADYYSQIMPLEIKVGNKDVECKRLEPELIKAEDLEISAESIKIYVDKGKKGKVKFKATISCQSSLDITAINESNEILNICSSKSGTRIKGGGCQAKGSFLLTVGTYACIFGSPGDKKYGSEDKELNELLELYKSNDQELYIRNIIDNTAGVSWSRDSVNVVKVAVEEKSYPKSDSLFITIQRCLTKEGRLKITGKTNSKDSKIKWAFSAKGFKVDGQTKIKSDNTFDFMINCIDAEGNYILTLDTRDCSEKFAGRIHTKSSVKIQSMSIPAPRAISKATPKIISKPTPTPIIKITPRSTSTPTKIKVKQRIPEPTPTPKTSHSILASIAAITISSIFLKRKKFRNAFG